MSLHTLRRNIFFIAFLFVPAFAQGVNNLTVFDGEIRGEARGATAIELLDSTTQAVARQSIVDANGMFVLRDVPRGTYLVRVTSTGMPGGSTRVEIPISVGETEEKEKTAPAGTISVGTLASPPSKKALKILEKAQHYSERGDSAKAIEVLKSGAFDAAGAPYIHSRLGTEYLKTGQFALAVPELLEASKLQPKESAHHSNLAYAYQAMRNLDAAETEARRALELDHTNPRAHYLLGAVLLERPATLDEAVENLKLARRELPNARFLLVQAYMAKGQHDAANREMRDFLQVASEAQRAAARSWLDRHR